ncbi:MAG: hypothetical protein M3N30_04590 [Bacteroidota bacterium]|nr:hypothetical protein [Bacteroidota bacterium]
MFRNRLLILLWLFSMVVTKRIMGQACIYYPADCPSDRQLGDSADRLVNPILPEEISMEIRLHDLLTRLMQKQAEIKGWEVYSFDESDGTGYLNADRSGPLEFNLRPPHDYEISFIFIVNKDSLLAWKDWQKDFLLHMQEQVVKAASDHEYSAFAKMQEAKKISDERFRNASMIRVKIEVNPADAAASSITDDLHRTRVLNIPHAAVAFESHNAKTDERAIFDLNQLNRCTDLAFLLFGNWNVKPDEYQIYRPSYNRRIKNALPATTKTIGCDKVQAIAMHVEGAPVYINQFLQSLDAEKIENTIWKYED